MSEQVAGGKGDDPPVNASGKLADGRPYDGSEEFKRLLAQDVDRFAEAFVEQLGDLRPASRDDDRRRPAVEAIAAASRKDDYRLRTVIENFVLSDLFQQR